MKQPLTHLQVINLWSSLEDFRAAIGITIEAARKMRQRGNIPAGHWLTVADAAKKANHPEVTVEKLALAALKKTAAE